MHFPAARPDACPVDVWTLQNQLIALAEHFLGPRDAAKKLYRPTFVEDGPYVINTPNLDGAFAALSLNAAGYWPTTVYELGHETVHLLNPTVGSTTWFEEGIAVLFSIAALAYHKLRPQSPTLQSYQDALAMVTAIPGEPFAVARAVRAGGRTLASVTYEDLASVMPTCEEAVLRQLVTTCVPR